jgi:subtilase family serine protease
MNKVVMFLLATVVVASGCTVSGAQPEPEIVQTDTLIGVIGDLDGRATIMATIYNKGDSGEVDVRAETFDDGVIATTRETVYI